jgi:hypothetical protein
MHKLLIAAGALALGIAVASPLAPAQAQTSDQPQAGPPPAAQGQPGTGGPGGMPGRPGMPGHPGAGWQGQAMMGHHWMHGRMMMTPRQRCEEKLARRAGIVAYTITKLNLTAQQKPLWNRVQTALQAAGDKARQLCVSLPSREAMRQQTVLDRMNRREQALSAHLQALQQVKPAMQQFYQSLTPDQQAILNHPFRPG